jgi:hypothetical protein
MRRLFIICLIISLVSLTCQSIWSIYRSNKGDTVKMYNRFHTVDSNGTHFNWWSLVFPLQSEAQKLVKKEVSFKDTVRYEIAHNYVDNRKLNEEVEKAVVDSIVDFLSDTKKRLIIDFWIDYDKTSKEVRDYQNPAMRDAIKPYGNVSYFGTASPDAASYGMRTSLEPGHLEKENDLLSWARLSRTQNGVDSNLRNRGVEITTLSRNAAEVQLASSEEADRAFSDLSILNELRYVAISGFMYLERLEITTMSLPVLLPLWIPLLYFLLSLFRKSREKSTAPSAAYTQEDKQKEPRDWSWIWWTLGALALGSLIWLLWDYLYDILIWLLWILAAIGSLALLNWLWRKLNFGSFFRWIRNWWRGECDCCKFFIIATIVLTSFLLITHLLGLWYVVLTF